MCNKRFCFSLITGLLLITTLFAQNSEKIKFIPTETLFVPGAESQSLREGTLLSEGFEANLDGWGYIDNDGDGAYWGIYEEDASNDMAHTGSRGAGISYNAAGNDDWLITPQMALPSNETATFSLWARSDGGYNTLESFKVMVSTAGTDISDFTATVSTESNISVDWTQYTYDLTAYAGQNIYIALVCISVDQYYLWADDFLVETFATTVDLNADFSSDVTSGMAPLTVNFTDASAGNPTVWQWDFNDDSGVDDYSQNPSYTFLAPGTYPVTLFVSDGTNSDTETKIDYITVTVSSTLTADFSADVTSGVAPLAVQFTDASTGSTTNWSWDFDNNGTIDATSQNPSHEYAAPGNYTVSLTVSDGTNNASETKTDYITVNDNVIPGDDPDGWFLQNPYPTANWLSSVFSLDNNTTFSVGDGGLILKTEDDGETWITIPSGTRVALKDIYFPTATTGYIVGDNTGYGEPGVLLKTVDAGNSWTTLTSNINYQLNGVFFTDSNTGWIVGDGGYNSDGAVSKTTDGGITWTTQSSRIADELYSVFFIDENVGWIGGDRYCSKTIDGGATWTRTDVTYANYNSLYDIHFLDANNGWAAAGYQSLYQTTDGGASWTQVVPYDGELYTSVYFIDANNGWAATDGPVYQTTDGGASWTEQVDVQSYTTRMVFSSTAGYLVTGDGIVYVYTDGNWTEISSSALSDDIYASDNINNVHFVDENHGWIVGWMDDIWATTDGGTNWSVQATDAHYALYGLDFIDTNTGWAVGSGPSGNDVQIYATSNGGTNWVQQTSGTPNLLRSVDFLDANNGWAVGYRGTILNTNDAGINWTLQTSNTESHFYSIFMLNTSTGWICGSSGSVLKTTDGGSTWTAHDIDISQTLSSIFFLNENHGFTISTDKGYIFETTDGGVSWTSILGGSYTDPALRQIKFVDDLNGWIVGDGGTIFATEDGGVSWAQQNNPVGVVLEAVCFINATTGWAVGDNGLIIKTTDGGGTYVGIENEVMSSFAPESCTLNQNYPNPFNPSTTIQYALPEAGPTTLLIYDIRGNLVKTLVSESQAAGWHAISWNGVNHSGQPVATGLYLAQLQIGSSTQTIKMLMIKQYQMIPKDVKSLVF